MTTSAIATTIAASATSVAAASAPVNSRKTIAAAITSVTPMPIREMTAGRDSPLPASRPAASAGRAGRGGAPAVAACVPGVRSGSATVAADAPGRPTDWRQMSAPPAATSTNGHVSASENGSCSSRIVSSSETTRKPTPSAISTAARRLRAVRCAAAASAASADASPSAGTSIQASA